MRSDAEFEALRRQFVDAFEMWSALERASPALDHDDALAEHLERLSLEIARHPAGDHGQLRVKVGLLRAWLLDHLVADASEGDPFAVAVRHVLDDVIRLSGGDPRRNV